ncbi:MAG: fumarylacetoacetate hydrolase family protein [Thermosulfidibacteraceae bacterium]|jgi:2-keto-4-pentenoate hydratase/2-oxohepta-3-ene-1,7-dioic acid hydratase in catechol pathway
MKIGYVEYEGVEFSAVYEEDRCYLPEIGEFALLEDVKILVPAKPTKIVAVALNYREHAKEMGKPIPDEPLIFLKPTSAIINPFESIKLPAMSRRVDYEGELAVVIGKVCSNVEPDEVDEYILGYTCFNDITARDLQKKDGLFTRAKGFDTFAPFGPWIVTDIDPSNLRIRTKLNGNIVQEGSTSDMIFDVRELVSFISKIMTLYPGDVIATGTPSGVGFLSRGDKVEVEIEGIGSLVNFVE